ncbi:hypothetical protein [Staphylococcus simulans]|uniref:hypothetical protein n=1 Tax=Staphylococcus simulans TaxID=1286 RepID=UPI0021D2B8D7|nr:hypothetical protein [Staphylococcus simulans]UXR31213.1 hypothetical protein MUA73_04915 [Staphylococcus simulans]UXV42884.1 hypothetical protein MUA12_02755 [Staphylococcus simulans]
MNSENGDLLKEVRELKEYLNRKVNHKEKTKILLRKAGANFKVFQCNHDLYVYKYALDVLNKIDVLINQNIEKASSVKSANGTDNA